MHALGGSITKVSGQVHHSVEGDLGRLADRGSLYRAHTTHEGFGGIQMTRKLREISSNNVEKA